MLRAFLAGRIMRNIWITVSYEGSGYAGFQRQENRMTVQEMLENCLLELTGEKTTLYFVARTDAGVHAYGQECTFYTDSTIPGDRFIYAMNARLRGDIRVTKSCEMDEDFSVRRRNYGKTYGYLLTESREASPFLKRYIWRTGKKLDLEKMRKAARALEGRHDFTSFRGNNSVPSDPVRNIHEIRVEKDGDRPHLRDRRRLPLPHGKEHRRLPCRCRNGASFSQRHRRNPCGKGQKETGNDSAGRRPLSPSRLLLADYKREHRRNTRHAPFPMVQVKNDFRNPVKSIPRLPRRGRGTAERGG